LHDAVSAERAGTPAIGIMTDPFVDAAELMAEALGAPGYPFVVIEHPIANRNTADLSRAARAALEQAVRLLGVEP
jgi:hypothetical protein